MILTKEQCDWVQREQENLKRLVESKPKYGLFRFIARQEALDLIIELHNMAMKKQCETMNKLKEKRETN
jgi:hypothetical protein